MCLKCSGKMKNYCRGESRRCSLDLQLMLNLRKRHRTAMESIFSSLGSNCQCLNIFRLCLHLRFDWIKLTLSFSNWTRLCKSKPQSSLKFLSQMCQLLTNNSLLDKEVRSSDQVLLRAVVSLKLTCLICRLRAIFGTLNFSP